MKAIILTGYEELKDAFKIDAPLSERYQKIVTDEIKREYGDKVQIQFYEDNSGITVKFEVQSQEIDVHDRQLDTIARIHLMIGYYIAFQAIENHNQQPCCKQAPWPLSHAMTQQKGDC